jgi:hypothetical protein
MGQGHIMNTIHSVEYWLPNDSAIASLPAVMLSSTLYRVSPDAD